MRYRTLAAISTFVFIGAAGAAGTSDPYIGSNTTGVTGGGSGMQGSLSQVFDRLDHNADNIVSKNEARQHTWFSDRQFVRYDKDMNGTLDRVELETAGAASNEEADS